MVVKSGNSSYGHCWIEQENTYYYVYIMDGRSKYGPYSSFSDAVAEFNRWCP